MARRSEHTTEELRKMAIDAGSALIDAKGYQQFSARGAAAAMGYTVGTLYHLFGDLDTFILHINARTLDEWFAAYSALPAAKPEARARAFAQGYYQFAKTHYNRWLALFEHQMKPEDLPEWFRTKVGQMFDIFEQAILAHTDGDKKKAARIAKLLWASVHGICALSLAGKLDQVKADRAEKMIDDLLAITLKSP